MSPSFFIGTWASTRARDSSSFTPFAARKPGKSMKLVPTALTMTPDPATSAATLRTSMFAAARAVE